MQYAYNISFCIRLKKLLDSQALFFFLKLMHVGSFLFLFFWSGTSLDIWVCLAKQNGGGFTESI